MAIGRKSTLVLINIVFFHPCLYLASKLTWELILGCMMTGRLPPSPKEDPGGWWAAEKREIGGEEGRPCG